MNPAAKLPGAHATLSLEWSILLAACSTNADREKHARLRPLVQQGVQWTSLFELAERHGVSALLYQSLSTVDCPVPADALRILRDNYHRNLHKALFLSRELIRIFDQLSALGIEVMPYKGLTLAESMYGDIALRQSGDLDMLIHAQDLSAISNTVRDLGYTPHASFSAAQQRAYLKSGYELSFDGEAGPNLLELQWDIQPGFYAVDYDMAGIFERAVSVEIAGHPMRTPSAEDLLLVLSLHAAKHVWGRLIWLRDIAQIVAFPSLNWNWIEAQSRGLGITRILAVNLILARDLLETALPINAQNLVQDSAALTLAGEIKDYIASETQFDVESLSYFRLMLRLRERQSDRMRFLHRLALTPGPGEWKAVNLPALLFPLYRLVRLARLASRVVRR